MFCYLLLYFISIIEFYMMFMCDVEILKMLARFIRNCFPIYLHMRFLRARELNIPFFNMLLIPFISWTLLLHIFTGFSPYFVAYKFHLPYHIFTYSESQKMWNMDKYIVGFMGDATPFALLIKKKIPPCFFDPHQAP